MSTTKQRNPFGGRMNYELTPGQSRLAADFYPYAIAMADRKASLANAEWLGDRLRDAATTELFRAAQMFAGTDGTPFKGYLARCLRLKLSDTNIGRKARHRRNVELNDADLVASPDTGVDEFDSFEGLIRSLDPRSRQILKLHFWDDLSLAQVAARMGMSRTRVSVAKDRAMRELRGRLEMVSDGPRLREAS